MLAKNIVNASKKDIEAIEKIYQGRWYAAMISGAWFVLISCLLISERHICSLFLNDW